MPDPKPNPGSAEARAIGCICPVIDNHHGRGRGGDGARYGWYMRADCWLHKPLEPVTVELADEEGSHA